MTEMGNFGMGAVGVESAMLSLSMPGATSGNEESSFERVLDSVRDSAASDKSRPGGPKAQGGRGEVVLKERETAEAGYLAAEPDETSGAPMAKSPDAVERPEEPKRDEMSPSTVDGGVEAGAEELAQACAQAVGETLPEVTAQDAVAEGAAEAVAAAGEPMPVDLPVPDLPKTDGSEGANATVEGEPQAVEPGAIFKESAQGEAAKADAEAGVQGDAKVVAQVTGESKAEGNPMLDASRAAATQTQQAEGAANGESLHAAPRGAVATEAAVNTTQSVEGAVAAPGATSVPDGAGAGSEGGGSADNGASSGGEASAVHGELGRGDGARNADFAGKLDRAQESVRAQQPDAMERMVKTMRVAFEKGESRVRIMLNPPELGSVRVNMSLKDGVLNASFEAQNQASRHALAQDLPMLRHALEDQGIEVGEFSVNVENGETGSQSFDENAVDSPGYASGGEAAGVSGEAEDEPYDILAEQRRIMGGTSVLDLIA